MSDRDGTEKFYISEGCGTAMKDNSAKEYINVPMKTLRTLMNELRHDYIEGTEFAVLPEVLSSGVNFGQLCVEVHNRFYEDGDTKIKGLISQLNNAGYYIVSVSPNYEELTFIRR